MSCGASCFLPDSWPAESETLGVIKQQLLRLPVWWLQGLFLAAPSLEEVQAPQGLADKPPAHPPVQLQRPRLRFLLLFTFTCIQFSLVLNDLRKLVFFCQFYCNLASCCFLQTLYFRSFYSIFETIYCKKPKDRILWKDKYYNNKSKDKTKTDLLKFYNTK